MNRPWLAHYPPGVPAEIDATRYTSLAAMFEESFKANAARTACICMGTTLSYGDLDATSRAFAAWLQSRGVKPGSRVALMMPNVLQYSVAIAGTLRAGCVVVNVNPLYKPRELEFQLNDADADTIVVLENFAGVLQEALPRTQVKHVVVASLGDMLGTVKGALVNAVVRHIKKMVPRYNLPTAATFKDVMRTGAALPFTAPKIGPDDIAFLQYTGGTTGVAKGAMLLHRNLVGGHEQPLHAVTELIGQEHRTDHNTHHQQRPRSRRQPRPAKIRHPPTRDPDAHPHRIRACVCHCDLPRRGSGLLAASALQSPSAVVTSGQITRPSARRGKPPERAVVS